MKACMEEKTTRHILPFHHFPFSFLSAYLPWVHLHSSPQLSFPFCCQATDRNSITWRHQNHRKSLQGDTSCRCSMEEPGSICIDLKNLLFGCTTTAGPSTQSLSLTDLCYTTGPPAEYWSFPNGRSSVKMNWHK